MREAQEKAQANLRRLEEELASTRDSINRRQGEIERNQAERDELRRELADLNSAREQLQAATARELELVRQDTQAKIAALQSEIAHKTSLLTQNQTTISHLEQELQARSGSVLPHESEKQALLERHAAEIARLESEMAELRGLAQQQQQAAADELARARETFAVESAGLRNELREKQRLLEQRQDGSQLEQELRNRHRELQGRLAAKESVIESQEYHLRNAQSQLLIVRDELGEKERALAEWQARAAEQQQRHDSERHEWQCRIAEAQIKVEGYHGEIERLRNELATAQTDVLQERSANQERAQELIAQAEALATQLQQKQERLDRHDETLRRKEAQVAELSVSVREAREALERQQTTARAAEQDFSARLAGLTLELERKNEALRERDARASRAEPAFKAQIDDLQSQLQEKDHVLEARSREIAILQARAESLSGEAARLEAARTQALADAALETDRTREALLAEIAALQSTQDRQQALLEERQAMHAETEQSLRAELDGLKERSAEQERIREKQTADLAQAAQEANVLRERLAQLEAASHHAEAVVALRAHSDAERIAALERQLQSMQQILSEREAALQRAQNQPQSSSGGLKPAQDQHSSGEQSAELTAARHQVTELLDRLAQLEAARHTLQENAAHELQQLRESFETRIAGLRMELAAKEQSRGDNRTVGGDPGSPEEGSRTQTQELQRQLAEHHALLESRNEELIRVKAELDALQDHFALVSAAAGETPIVKPPSVELREEDIVDAPERSTNGSSRPDPVEVSGATHRTTTAIEAAAGGTPPSNRFTQLEGRVRSWNPVTEKESAFGTGRRWNLAIFKRRWKA
jgi:chromosome segregation ATPase